MTHQAIDSLFLRNIAPTMYGRSYFIVTVYIEDDYGNIDLIVPVSENKILEFDSDFSEYIDIDVESGVGIAGGRMIGREDYLTFIDTDGKIILPNQRFVEYNKKNPYSREIEVKNDMNEWFTIYEDGSYEEEI